MNQESLFYENIYDALKEIVKVAKGNKEVGRQLWPEKAADAAGRLLADCLNESKAEKLSPEQFMFILRLGRKLNCHAAMNYITRDAGYEDAKPVDPEDEKTALQRAFIDAVKHMSGLQERWDKLHANAPSLRAAA